MIIEKLPLISCLMVTAGGRPASLAKKSIDCFARQTYANKELVVVNEGPKERQLELDKYIQSLGRTDIRTVWLNGEYNLGNLRNISAFFAEGDYLVQWDDDDFCLPHRLAVQYAFLARHPHALACYLSDQLHYYFPTKTLYWDNWERYHSGGGIKKYSLIPGTVMVKAGLGIKYPSTKSFEDSVYADQLLEMGSDAVVLLRDMGYMHMYTFHGSQVYDINHHMGISQLRSQEYATITKYRERIIDTLNYLDLEGPIKVMARDNLAFTWNGK